MHLYLLIFLPSICYAAPLHLSSIRKGKKTDFVRIRQVMESMDALAVHLDGHGDVKTDQFNTQQRHMVYSAINEQLDQLSVDITMLLGFLCATFQLEDAVEHEMRSMEDLERKVREAGDSLRTIMDYYRTVETDENALKTTKQMAIVRYEGILDVIQFLKEQIRNAVAEDRSIPLVSTLNLLGTNGSLGSILYKSPN